jgi:hypothetical protein
MKDEANASLAQERHENQPPEPRIFSEYSGFRSSFRIIAKQDSIRKTGTLFELDSTFDVFYTVEPDPVYKVELEKFRCGQGRTPLGYRRLLSAYDEMTHQIRRLMPHLPIFRDLFEQLKVINFFCYYLKTLKKAQKIPVLQPLSTIVDVATAAAAPPLLAPPPAKRRDTSFSLSADSPDESSEEGRDSGT